MGGGGCGLAKCGAFQQATPSSGHSTQQPLMYEEVQPNQLFYMCGCGFDSAF